MRALELLSAALLLALPVAAQTNRNQAARTEQRYDSNFPVGAKRTTAALVAFPRRKATPSNAPHITTSGKLLYAPLNSWSATTEYANSSSHIILGSTRQRKFAGLTLAYQRRISANRWMAWDYSLELRPFLVESDPTVRSVNAATTVDGVTYNGSFYLVHQAPIENTGLYRDYSFTGTIGGQPFSAYASYNFGRRWTYAPGITPACFAVHLLPAHRLQPFLDSTGGFVVSPRDIPVFQSSAFNFTFSFGGGVEYFRDHQHSWSLDYRVEHLSNKSIGYQNPGIDSQFLRVGYRFGR